MFSSLLRLLRRNTEEPQPPAVARRPSEGFRARLRFRIAKPFHTDDLECFVTVCGHQFRISSMVEGQTLKDADWLVANANEIPTEAEAKRVGERLRLSLLVASLCRRVGIDAGIDKATSAPGREFAENYLKETGFALRANVHGLDVFPQSPPSRILTLSATGMVRTTPEPFFEFLGKTIDLIPGELPQSQPAIILLNAALINREPLAQLVLAISAVEMLAQGEKWSEPQLALLKALGDAAKESDLSSAEREEVSEAIRKAFRFSIRQSVFRLLQRLGLDDLRPSWDKIYNSRSAIFHGTLRLTSAEHSQLASEATFVCSRVVLTQAQSEGVPNDLDLLM